MTSPRAPFLSSLLAVALLTLGCGGHDAEITPPPPPPPPPDTTPHPKLNPSIGGSVLLQSDGSKVAVAGAAIEFMSDTNVVNTVTVAADGTWKIDSIPAGSYTLRLQPPPGYSMGSTEAGTKPVVIPSSGLTTVNFNVQPAIYYEDFQVYTDSADLMTRFGTRHGISRTFVNPNFITLDPTGGPNGTKAMRYNFPAQPTSCSNFTIYGGPRWAAGTQPQVDTVWIRMLSKETAGFSNGTPSCTGSRSYKWLLVDIGSNLPPNASGRFGTYMDGPNSDNHMLVDMTDRHTGGLTANFNTSGRDTRPHFGPSTTWAGQWHVWVLQITGVGTDNAMYNVFLDGKRIEQLIGPFHADGNDKSLIDIQLGANINFGPDIAENRWFRELGVYKTRPSMKPLP